MVPLPSARQPGARPFRAGSSRPRRGVTLIVLCALTGPLLVVGPVAAAPPTTQVAPVAPGATPTTSIPTVPGLVAGASPDGTDLPYLGDPRVDPDLGGVAVDTADFRVALGRYRTSEKSMKQAQATFRDAVGQLEELRAAEARLVGTYNQATRRQEKSSARLDQLRGAIAQLAIDDYIRGSNALPTALDFDIGAMTETRRQRVVVKTVRSRQLAEADLNAEVVTDTTKLLSDTTAELDDVRTRISSTTAARDQAAADAQRYAAQLPAEAKAIADARLTGAVTGLDFVFVALDAYVKAAKKMAVEQPSCGIRWQLVAGISRTEGRHGTFDGATLDANGTESKPIIGIALDGSAGTAAVADSDGGKYDGDPTTDRAVGPMQFIPSTWAKFGRDGNNDGQIDPQNMYDAALAATAYLCRFGPGLNTDEGILRALLHYNNDAAYGQLVLDRTHGYDAYRLPPPPKAS